METRFPGELKRLATVGQGEHMIEVLAHFDESLRFTGLVLRQHHDAASLSEIHVLPENGYGLAPLLTAEPDLRRDRFHIH